MKKRNLSPVITGKTVDEIKGDERNRLEIELRR